MTAVSARRRYLVLTALRWLPVGTITPLVVLLMVQRGLGLAEVALVLLPSGVVVLLLELPTGGLADSWGRRPIVVVSALVEAAALLLLATARVPLGFAAAYAVFGVARALSSGPLEAWFVDATKATAPAERVDADVRRGLAAGGTVEALALALGAVAGGLLPPLFSGLRSRPEALVTALSIPILVGAGLAVLHAAVAVALLPRVPRRARHEQPRTMEVIRGGLDLAVRWVDVRLLLLAGAGAGAGLVAFELYWQPHLVGLMGVPPERATALLGPLMATIFAAAAAGSALAPRIGRWLGGARGAAAGHGLFGLGLGLAGLTTSPWLAGACFLLAYAGNGLSWPLQHDLLHARVDEAHRTVALSMSSLGLQGGGALAKVLLLAPIAGAFGVPAAWGATAVVLALSALALLGVRDHVRTPVRV